MKYFEIGMQIVGTLLFTLGAWHGIVDELYAQATFEIVLAYGALKGL